MGKVIDLQAERERRANRHRIEIVTEQDIDETTRKAIQKTIEYYFDNWDKVFKQVAYQPLTDPDKAS